MPTNNPSLHYIDAGKLAPTGDHANCERFWANIKAQHAAIYGPDSAYNFAACNEHGIRMVGRGWNRDSAANGQENGVDYNPGSRALVALMGSDDVPTPQFTRAVNAFAQEAYARGMVPPLRPHSSFVATSCPGDRLRALVDEVNAGAAGTAYEEDEVTPEQMSTIGQWMKDTEARIEKKVLDTLGQWEQDTRKQINTHTDAAVQKILDALK